MAEPIFTHTEYLSDPANPSHAWCSSCSTLQPIENFIRKPTRLQAANWGWDKMRDKRGAMFLSNECNACAKKRKVRARHFDYDAYNRELQLTGRYEYLVANPKKPKEYIHKRELMVAEMRERRKDKQRASGTRSYKKQQKPVYTAFMYALRVEKQRVRLQIKQMKDLTPTATAYLHAYMAHLDAINGNIRTERYDACKQARESINHYINPLAITTKESKALFLKLGGYERERVACKFLDPVV